MAVIIREKRTLGEEEVENIPVYKTAGGLVTREERERADKLDALLKSKMKEIKNEMKATSLIKLKGKSNVIKLWYEIGKRLQFIDKTDLIKSDERNLVFRALYDHAGILAPGPLSERAQRSPATSHFSYAYQLGKFNWNFVKGAGDWTSWSEFFDSAVIRRDKRIIQWLAEKQKEKAIKSQQDWLRPLAREIRRALRGYDTSVFNDKELKEKLEIIFKKVFS